jgi:hypothetical protein
MLRKKGEGGLIRNGKGREILNSHNEWSEIVGRRDKNVKFLTKGKGTMQNGFPGRQLHWNLSSEGLGFCYFDEDCCFRWIYSQSG